MQSDRRRAAIAKATGGRQSPVRRLPSRRLTVPRAAKEGAGPCPAKTAIKALDESAGGDAI